MKTWPLAQGWFPALSEIRHDTELRPLIARMSRRVLLAMSRAERIKDRARRALGTLKAFSVRTPEGFELSIDVEPPHPNVQGDLDEGFFIVRFERATAAERRYMAAVAALGDGPQESGRVARRLGFAETGKTSVIRGNLIDKGLIFSPEYGLVDFTVPRFAEFMRRNFPLDAA